MRTTEERKKERKKTEGRRESIKAHVHNHHHVPEMGIAWVVCSVGRSAVSWVWWHWRVALLVALMADGSDARRVVMTDALSVESSVVNGVALMVENSGVGLVVSMVVCLVVSRVVTMVALSVDTMVVT